MYGSGRFVSVVYAIGLLWVLAVTVTAQQPQRCLEPGRLEVLRKQISESAPTATDKRLHDELLEASDDLSLASRTATLDKLSTDPKKQNPEKPRKKQRDLDTVKQENVVRVCAILNKGGWPMRSAVGKDGLDAFLILLSRALPIAFQVELYPLVIEAFDKNQIERGQLLAGYIDRLRLNTGQKQLFGTQVYVRDGFLVMAPIEEPSRVNQRRTEFNMSPIHTYERFLENTYKKLLIRAVMEPIIEPTMISLGRNSLESPAAVDEEGEQVERVKTALVLFDVVLPDASDPRTAALEKRDFRVYENDRPVSVEFLSQTQAAFDIVLVLDLSGSTANKIDLIRKSTKRFITMKRPIDRLAIVAFDDAPTVVSALEADSLTLQNRVGKLRGGGGSRIWDAVKFSLDLVEQGSEKGRRKAIVLMSDGVDNRLSESFFGQEMGSGMSFADLVEQVQKSSTSIFPIYLDTEYSNPFSKVIYANARLSLTHLADQSAGNMYFAKKLEDLDNVYNRVLRDVGTVYTVGFTSPEPATDRRWQTLRVEIPSIPGVKLKHRPGYFVH